MIYVINLIIILPHRANWIKVHGIKYKKSCVLCISIDLDVCVTAG